MPSSGRRWNDALVVSRKEVFEGAGRCLVGVFFSLSNEGFEKQITEVERQC